MLTKIIFTLLVVAGCLWFAASKRGKDEPPVLVIASPADQARSRLLRHGAFTFMLIMIIAASVMIYLELADNYTTVTVRVINTQSGVTHSYQARREDVQASSFTTVDGRQVFVAGIERIEVEAD